MLWAELCRQLSKSASDVALDSHRDADGLRSATIGTGRYLMLTSWRSLLGRMAAAADSHTEADIRQLQGLAEQQDEEAFLPLRQEELGPQLPRRVIDLTGLVDDAVNCANQTEWASTKGSKMVGTATSYGVGLRFLRAETVFGEAVAGFGVEYRFWAQCGHTPLWLYFWTSTTPPDLLSALEPLRHRDPPELIESDEDVRIPIKLPVGKERGAVLDAVVARLEEIARLIAPET